MTNFSKFLTSHTSQFYVNAMSGRKPKSLQNAEGYTDEMFSRQNHGFAHFVVRYFKGTDFKDFSEARYYYIIRQDIKDNKFKVRDDLIKYFRNTQNLYVLLLTDKWACEIKSTELIVSKAAGNYHQVIYETSCMNTDLNWIHVFTINTKYAKKVDLTKVEENKELTKYLNKSVDFIEKVAYAKYRNRKESRGILVTNVKTGKVTPFKSVKQCYDLFIKPSQFMGYRKFRDSTKQGQIKVVGNKSEYLIESIPCNKTDSKDDSDLCALCRLEQMSRKGPVTVVIIIMYVTIFMYCYSLFSTNLNLVQLDIIYRDILCNKTDSKDDSDLCALCRLEQMSRKGPVTVVIIIMYVTIFMYCYSLFSTNLNLVQLDIIYRDILCNKTETDSPTLCSSDILDTIMSTLLPNVIKCPVYKMDTSSHLVMGQALNTLETPTIAYQINFDNNLAIKLQTQLDSRRVMEVPGKGKNFVTINSTLDGTNCKDKVTEYNWFVLEVDHVEGIDDDNVAEYIYKNYIDSHAKHKEAKKAAFRIIYSGRRSYHFWFYVENEITSREQYKAVHKYLNDTFFGGIADDAINTPEHYVRAPSLIRKDTGKEQKLVSFKGRHTIHLETLPGCETAVGRKDDCVYATTTDSSINNLVMQAFEMYKDDLPRTNGGRGKAILKKLIKEEERGFLDNNSLKELARIMCDYCGCPEKYERLVEYL